MTPQNTTQKDMTVEITVQTQLFDLNTVEYVTVEQKTIYDAITSDEDFKNRIPDDKTRLELQKLAFETLLRRQIKAKPDGVWMLKGTETPFSGVSANEEAFNDTVRGLMKSFDLGPDATVEQKRAARAEVIEIIKASPRIIEKLRKKIESTEAPTV